MTPSWQFWMNWIAQIAIAIGTIGAVIAALFGHWLRGRFVPQKLVLKLLDDRGVKTPVVIAVREGSTRETIGRWYHLRVKNERRWSPATDVQVLLLRVEEPDASGVDKITWAGEIPIRWAHQEISPLLRKVGNSWSCDLCSVIKNECVQLHPIIVPFGLDAKRMEASNMTVTMQARSLESDSDPVRVKIAWDGGWADDSKEITRHMVVRLLDADEQALGGKMRYSAGRLYGAKRVRRRLGGPGARGCGRGSVGGRRRSPRCPGFGGRGRRRGRCRGGSTLGGWTLKPERIISSLRRPSV